MRPLPIALALCVVALPAAAQSRAQAEQAAAALENPFVQEGVATMVDQMVGALLATRVGPLARYTDPRDDVRPNDTLRDLQRRRDPQFEARLHDDTRRAVAVTGATARDTLAMADELQRTVGRLQAAIGPLAGALQSYRPAPDGYDDDY
jgi:hypothetical protein